VVAASAVAILTCANEVVSIVRATICPAMQMLNRCSTPSQKDNSICVVRFSSSPEVTNAHSAASEQHVFLRLSSEHADAAIAATPVLRFEDR
jgi:hypothetical protein